MTTLRRDAAANRERLISAALDVFNSTGLDAGVEQIAERAGVGIGTLYRRFPTKDALIDFLVDELMADISESAAVARGVANGHGLEHYLRQLAERLCLHRGCLPRIWEDQRDHTELSRRVSVLLREAKAAGAVRSGVTRQDITAISWSLRGIIESAGDDAARCCQRHIDHLFAGMHMPVERMRHSDPARPLPV